MNGRPPDRGRLVLFAATTLAVVLGLLELATRRFMPAHWIVERRAEEDRFLVAHPERGYAFKSDYAHTWRSADYAVLVELNERGLRDAPLADARAADLRVLALGDSYTFGLGVEGDANWPAVLEERLRTAHPESRVAVLDAGIPAYSAHQIRQLGEELVPLLDPQVVVFALYAASHWRVERPYVMFDQSLVTTDRVDEMAVASDRRLVITAFPPGPLRTLDLWLKNHFEVGAHLLALVNGGRHWTERPPPDHSEAGLRRAFAPVVAEIEAVARLARDRAAGFVVVAVNAQAENGSFAPEEPVYNRILAEACAARGISFVDPLPVFVEHAAGRPIFRFPTDNHWTRAAHALVASLLEPVVERALGADREVAGPVQFDGGGRAGPAADPK